MSEPRYARLEVWRSDNDQQWYARVRAPNGKILMSSAGYRRHTDAERCADLVRNMLVVARVVKP